MKKYLVAAAVLCLALTAGAKKMTILNVDKGQVFNTVNNTEVSLTEEQAPKKGQMMMKLDINKGGWWAGMENPNKSWAGFDVMKFHVFNPQKQPVKLALHIKFNDYSCPWEKRFVYDFMVRPGKNDCEIELMGATTVDGTPIDWKTKICAASFCGEDSKMVLYWSGISLETQDSGDEKKDK